MTLSSSDPVAWNGPASVAGGVVGIGAGRGRSLGQRIAERGALLGLLLMWAGSLVFGIPLEQAVAFGGDEGIELLKAAHLHRGGALDASVWNDQPLTHTRLYAGLMSLREGALLPRLWSVAASIVLLVSVAALAQAFTRDRDVATVAAFLVAGAPLVMELSVSAMQEMPATAMGLASCAILARAGGRRSWRRLATAAGLAAFGAAIKLTAGLYMAAGFVLLLLSPVGPGERARRRTEGPSLRPLIFLLGGLTALRLLIAAVDGRSMADLLTSHWVAFEAAALADLAELPSLGRYLRESTPLLALFALGGAARLLKLRGSRALAMALTLPAFATAFNVGIRPWWMFYSLSLWAAWAPLAALAVVEALRAIPTLARAGLPRGGRALARWIPPVLAAWVVAASSLRAAQAVSNARQTERVGASRALMEIRPYLDPAQPRTGFAAEPIYMFWAGARTPADLLVVSRKRFLSGDMAREDLPRRVAGCQCDIVLAPLALSPPLLRAWQEALAPEYVLVAFFEGRPLYVRRTLDPTPYERSLAW